MAAAEEEEKNAASLPAPVDEASNVQDYSSSGPGLDGEDVGRILLNGTDDVDGEESREGSVFVQVTDSVVQVRVLR